MTAPGHANPLTPCLYERSLKAHLKLMKGVPENMVVNEKRTHQNGYIGAQHSQDELPHQEIKNLVRNKSSSMVAPLNHNIVKLSPEPTASRKMQELSATNNLQILLRQ